ncbi:MAG: family 10 glycosylhydrolase [Verrucomicrobia bacterium]|nr:family 10 glycosylhydrolase [Verrucomicrobiota bacterium]MCG2679272.1 family 10 glycosylhydrolase [Kiritimatiellia bacterium]MBU4247752.1 family 10 glycosylhydrolase [Verrucomicrobiota bacterium]MBU4290959.1 family 10 glycosylhydrolase [Verrucomicrobiota bacterium]MBU4430294.1 family 10 glycosylhydrolase [Verrucomicrobiota bacterium]
MQKKQKVSILAVVVAGIMALGSPVNALGNIRAVYQYGQPSTKAGIDRWIDQLASAKINTVVYFTGVAHGWTYFKSDFGNYTPDNDVDPIEYVVQKAHSKGIKVWGWWLPSFIEPTMKKYNLRPAVNKAGAKTMICINDPNFRQACLDLVKESLKRGVDGISIDDGYGMARGDCCYCDVCIEQAKKELGFDPKDLIDNKSAFNAEDLAVKTKAWKDWRVARVTEWVKFIHDEVKKIKPECTISSSGWETPERNIAERSFDMAGCLKAGYIDYCEPEVYCNVTSKDSQLVDRANAWKKATGEYFNRVIFLCNNVTYISAEKRKRRKTGPEMLRDFKVFTSAGASNLGLFCDNGIYISRDQLAAFSLSLPGDGMPSELVRTPGKVNILRDVYRAGTCEGSYDGFMSLFEARGAVVKYLNCPVTPEILNNADVYMITYNTDKYLPEECKALSDFVKSGGDVIVICASESNPKWMNAVLSEFGIEYGQAGGKPVCSIVAKHELTKDVKSVTGIGITPIKVSPPAKCLISDEKGVVALAVYEKGKSKIICCFDDHTLSNHKTYGLPGKDYSHKQLADNIVDWIMKR